MTNLTNYISEHICNYSWTLTHGPDWERYTVFTPEARDVVFLVGSIFGALTLGFVTSWLVDLVRHGSRIDLSQ